MHVSLLSYTDEAGDDVDYEGEGVSGGELNEGQ